jgi:hypothetical protein
MKIPLRKRPVGLDQNIVEISKSLDKIAIKQNHIAQNLKEISAEQKKASENFEKPNPSYRASETKTDRNESF